jgi:hypothetical protein
MHKNVPAQPGCLKSGQRGFFFDTSPALLWCTILAATLGIRCPAQTNASARFQGFAPGDAVRVKAQKPLLDLARAQFQSETPSNIVVTSKGDRYCLDKRAVTLSPPGAEVVANPAGYAIAVQAGTNGAGSAARPPAAVDAGKDLLTMLQGVEEGVLGAFRSDPGCAKASQYYQETMQGILKGKVSLEELASKAEETLKKVDEYQPERAKDPRFEEQISQLRQFVDRAHRGEKLNPSPARPE